MEKLLIIVDMQNDFITGSLGTEEAKNIVPHVQKKLQAACKCNETIVFTKDTHSKNYLSTLEGKNLPVIHCVKGEMGWELDSSLKEYEKNSLIFEKNTFGSTALMKYLEKNRYDEIELIGLCTDICVISNALLAKAVQPECKIIVDSSCCAGVTFQSHQTALEAMKMCQITIL